MISYEWNVMVMTPDGADIEDNSFSGKLATIGYTAKQVLEEPLLQLELVRYDGNDEDGLNDRWYAKASKCRNGGFVLEMAFNGGGNIPHRFYLELARWSK